MVFMGHVLISGINLNLRTQKFINVNSKILQIHDLWIFGIDITQSRIDGILIRDVLKDAVASRLVIDRASMMPAKSSHFEESWTFVPKGEILGPMYLRSYHFPTSVQPISRWKNTMDGDFLGIFRSQWVKIFENDRPCAICITSDANLAREPNRFQWIVHPIERNISFQVRI
jgi:hypothetical protein